jgi:hypothetical protein
MGISSDPAVGTTEEKDGSRAPFFGFGICCGVFVGALIRGNASTRAAAVAGALGVAAAALAGVRQRMREYDDGDAPSLGHLFSEWLAESGRFFVYLFTYGSIILLVALDSEDGPLSDTWAEPVFVAIAAAVLALAVGQAARDVWRKEGVERQVLFESATVAFFVTVLAAAAYAMAEVLMEAPPLSMWAVWMLGMFTWALATMQRSRALR